MRFRALAIGLLIASASCFAADVDGKWTGTMITPGGDFPVDFTFKADGATLNGTTNGPAPGGGETKIADGKVNGEKISFSVTFDFQGMPMTMNYTGAVAKDQIKFTIDVFGMTMELTVKKAG